MTESFDETGARLWSLASLATPMAIRVAATLRLADRIASGITSIAAISERTNTDVGSLRRLIRFLDVRGVLVLTDDDRVGLTELGSALLDTHPWNARRWLDIEGPIGSADLAFADLWYSVCTGKSAYVRSHGRTYWQTLMSDSGLSRSFTEIMATQLARSASEVVRSINWNSAKHVVDVGGGDGTLIEAILLLQDDLTATLVDLAEPVQAARARFGTALGERVSYVVQDFFDPLPGNGDTYILCGVLSDWGDDEAVTLLRNCVRAMPENSRLITVGGPYQGVSPEELAEMDIRMLVYFGGKERSDDELLAIASEAGLSLYFKSETCGRSLLEFRKHS